MKIALLNLQYDNNYGGNLQRYALMVTLQRMGHDVTHLNLRFNFNPQPWYVMALRCGKRTIKKILKNRRIEIFPELKAQNRYVDSCTVTDLFYNRYIKHTEIIDSKKKLGKHLDYDVFVVGSDQVWRKTIAQIYGIDTFFFDYLPLDVNVKRIAYGVSLGTYENELDDDDLERLTPLYMRFNAVSVREDSAQKLLDSYGWNIPKAEWVLDPTLLLKKEDYISLIESTETHCSDGNMFCYILDSSEEKDLIIKQEAFNRNLRPFQIGLNGLATIEQWLRSFWDAEYIVTDSYHGLIFSIIFNKPFRLIRNSFRGAARFDAVLKACGLNSDDGSSIDWNRLNNNLCKMKISSQEWLMQNI